MGDLNVTLASSDEQLKTFMRNLLDDIEALDYMISHDLFEKNITRIGAEQELCLIDRQYRPAPYNLEVLERSDAGYCTTELAKFNFEINLDPMLFKGSALSDMERQILKRLKDVEEAAATFDSDIILAGILPTIRKFDVELDNLTPLERYKALVSAIQRLRGGVFELRLSGIDELSFKTDSPLLEAANTGFQVHLQVHPSDFVKYYNIAQAVTAPVLAVSTNSPMLFGKRLWKETRIALFQQSVDTRKTSEHLRERSPRVTFGNDWLHDSILEIYKEDVSRFRVLLSSKEREDVFEKLERGEIPKLSALQIHNGTVYRWNRACYGVSQNIPHLRIENRVLGSGPTVADEMASAAFWLGMIKGMANHYDDISRVMDFDHAKNNFFAAARHGLDTHFRWINGERFSASELIKEELLPLARAGLESMEIDAADIDRYLGIIEARNSSRQTGADWQLDSYSELIRIGTRDEVITAISASMLKNQKKNIPVHLWEPASLSDVEDWKPYSLLVEEFMSTDLYTVQPSDILEFVAEMMDWRKIRYMPVEDDDNNLIGLITSRIVLRQMIKRKGEELISVGEVMIDEPITISPEATIVDAMNIMEKEQIGCLPVVKNQKLIGIITEQNFLHITRRLITRLSKG